MALNKPFSLLIKPAGPDCNLQCRYGRPGVAVQNSLQTNGLLITDELAKHFARYHFLLGVSLDGPEPVHDRYRVNAAGAGSFSAVWRGIERETI
ncbi:MAG: hypothetical protein KKE37_11980 [Verrucomicrobia bacterium]|nr:hypothetical protein [Verrucomicrobiota bacterium]MBU4290462.1 hypothetical protein [Verrucomicrobiota bacterium]MBU4430054.1 hypothetical protein [Verrucomicrobiota bacterium]MCG2681119.1 hypothetical protein [Kiritimatiellia bacterium]